MDTKKTPKTMTTTEEITLAPKEQQVRVTAYNWKPMVKAANWGAPSGASLTLRPRMDNNSSNCRFGRQFLAIGFVLALTSIGAMIVLNDPDHFITKFDFNLSSPSSSPNTFVEAIETTSVEAIQTSAPVPFKPITLADPTDAPKDKPMVWALEPGLRQHTREQALGHSEFSLKHQVGEDDNEGWWTFSLDLTSAGTQELRNASLVEIRIIVSCDTPPPVKPIVQHDRVLWQTSPDPAAALATRTHLGRMLRLSVDRSEHNPSLAKFKLFANPLTFQTLCEDPYKLTLVAVFRQPHSNDLVRSTISLYYEHNL